VGRYLGSWKLEDITYVTVQTSSVTTGAATDAESVPTWRMYEDNTITPITTGSFTTLNALAGFYVAAITLAAAIGYEKGKSYSLRVAATVGAVIGADVHSLQIEAEVDANSVSITVNANVSSMTAGAISAGAIVDGALTSPKFGAGFITAGSITDGALISSKFGAGFITAGSFSGNAIAGLAATVGATSVAAIAVKVWDEPKASHTTADTYGEYLDATISAITAGDTTVSATAAAAIAAEVWGSTRAAHATAGTFGEGVASVQGNVTGSVASVTNGVTVGATAAAAIAAQVTAGSIGAVTLGSTSVAAIAGAVTAGSIGAVTVGATAASAIAGAVNMTVNATAAAAIAVAVWDEPKAGHTTADTYGEYLDKTIGALATTLAAIQAKTDLIFAGTTGTLKADIRFVNGVSVTGNGQSGTEWGPGS
jgi:hypothetical protein